MRISNCKNLLGCIKRRHSVFVLMALILANLAYSQDMDAELELQPASDSKKLLVDRAPAYSMPSDEVIHYPRRSPSWVAKVFIEDDKGVMDSMRQQINYWREQEEWAENWHLESTGMADTATADQKSDYLRRHILKYADKRLSGEIKRAPKNSTLHAVGEVQKNLRPNTTVEVSENIKLRFKARVLQGKAMMKLQNPLMDAETVLKGNGRVNMHLRRDIKELGIQTSIDYDLREKKWTAAFDKQLTEKWSTRVSSEQNHDRMAFSSSTDRKVQLNFNQAF